MKVVGSRLFAVIVARRDLWMRIVVDVGQRVELP